MRSGPAVFLVVFLAAVLLAGVTGCVSPPEGVAIVHGRELNDIPVKENLEFVSSESYVPALAEGTKFRSWTGLYRGKGLMEEIGPWYVGEMKRQGWTFTGVVESKGPTFTYEFIKRDEEARITVYREYAAATGRSINMVRAEVHPRGTESFLPEDIETMKATGVAWGEPRDAGLRDADPGVGLHDPRGTITDVETISYTEEVDVEPDEGGSSAFLLEAPDELPEEPRELLEEPREGGSIDGNP